MSKLFNKAKFIGTVLSVMLCIPLAVNAADERKTYTTGTKTSTETVSNTWVQTGDNTWAMDVPDESGKTDGVYDVILTSEINKETGNQEWTYTFYVENNEKAYYVYEQMTKNGTTPLKDGYSSVGSGGSDESIVKAIEDDPGVTETKSYTITNTKDHTKKTPEYGALSITKTVSNPASMQNSNQVFTFTVTLSGSTGELKSELSGTKVFGDTAFVDGVGTVVLKKDEAVTITDIPAGITYKVEESVPGNYKLAEKAGNTGAIIKDSTSEAKFTNTSTYTKPERERKNFTLKKTVVDPANLSGGTEYTFHVLFEGLEPYDVITAKGTEEKTYTADGNGLLTIDIALKNKEEVKFSNIPVDASYQISEDGGDYTSSYKMTDGDIKLDAGNGTKGESLSTQKKTAVVDDSDVIVEYTNTVERLQDITVKKVSLLSDGKTNDDADTTQYNIKANFYGLTQGYKITTTSGILIADEDGEAESTFLVKAGQSITFMDIPVGATYQFTEEANSKIASYVISGDNLNVTKESNANTTFNKDLSTETETVDANENATVTFTNTAAKITKLIVEKYDSDGKTKLGGAEFELYYENGDPVNYKTVNGAGSNTIEIGSRGKSEELESELFTAGKYYLVETVAPEGHTINGEHQVFEIKEEDLGTTITVKVYDDKIVVLPSTGGTGRKCIYIIAGTLTAALIVLVILKARQRRYY